MRLTPENPLAARGGTITAWLAVLVLAGVVALAWLGYRAASEWQSNAGQLIARRQSQIAVSLTINLARDMRGVQSAVIDRREWGSDVLDSPEHLAEVLAPALRRYAYPEAFFASRFPLAPNFVVRSSRLPSWAAASRPRGRGGENGESGGVRWFENAEVADLLQSRLLPDAATGRQYSIFRLEIDGSEYQVVTRFLRGASDDDSPMAVIGFMVNMDWAKANYFIPMLDSVVEGTGVPIESQIVDPTGIRFALLDRNASAIGGRPQISPERQPTTRRLNAYFFDPAMASTETVHDLEQWVWALQVSAAEDPTLAIALRGARRTMLVLAAGALALGIGLMIIVRATRVAASVASMRSEFVSTVTHELKTPMSVIQSIGETMARGRLSSPEQQREYAQLLVQETYRLRHLIDNLLAYARVTEVADAFTFEPLQPEEVVEEVVHGFRKLLRDRGIEVKVSVATPLPAVQADRTSIVFALDNLLDNAMRHAGATRIELAARLRDNRVEFVVSDHGQGIREDELKRVQQPFVRGDAASRGSGLGLAIVRRIAAAHRGSFRLESRVGTGTTATLAIPAAAG
jgi:signal transduction histidine kinase